MDVTLPNGHTITGIPEGTSPRQIADAALAGGKIDRALYNQMMRQIEPARTLLGIRDTTPVIGALPATRGWMETQPPEDIGEAEPFMLRPDGRVVSLDALSLARNNPLKEAQIVTQQLPDAKVTIDPDGNLIVEADVLDAPPTIDGITLLDAVRQGRVDPSQFKTVRRRFYANRPGPSRQDALQIGNTVLFDVLPTAAGGAAGKTVVGRMARAGLGAMAGTGAQDLGAYFSGAEQAVDPEQLALAGGLGIAGEFGAAAVSRALRSIMSEPGAVVNGRLSQRAEQALQRLGVEPNEITDEMRRAFGRRSAQSFDQGATVTPEQAAAMAEADTLPVPVQLSRGQVTGEPGQQAEELAMRRGARGRDAELAAGDFFDRQEQALRENADAIQSFMGRETLEPHQGSGRIAQAIQERAAESKAQVDNAYASARQLARESRATIGPGYVQAFRKGAIERMSRDYDLRKLPKVAAALRDLEPLESAGRATNVRAKIDALESWRQSLSQDIRELEAGVQPGTSRPPELGALLRLRGEYDDYIAGLGDEAFASMDERALQAFKDARGMRRRHGELYQSDRLVQRLQAEGITPPEATNILFGMARIGSAKTAGESVRAVRAIANIVGRDSPEFAALQQEAFMHLLKGQREGTLSAAKYAQNFETAMRDASPFMREVFGTQTLERMRQLARVARRTQMKPQAGPPGGTGQDAVRAVTSMFGGTQLGRIVLARLGLAFNEGAERMAAQRAADAAFSGPLAQHRPLLPPAAGAAAAALSGPGAGQAERFREEQVRRRELRSQSPQSGPPR